MPLVADPGRVAQPVTGGSRRNRCDSGVLEPPGTLPSCGHGRLGAVAPPGAGFGLVTDGDSVGDAAAAIPTPPPTSPTAIAAPTATRRAARLVWALPWSFLPRAGEESARRQRLWREPGAPLWLGCQPAVHPSQVARDPGCPCPCPTCRTWASSSPGSRRGWGGVGEREVAASTDSGHEMVCWGHRRGVRLIVP